jgi:hypothetical protein
VGRRGRGAAASPPLLFLAASPRAPPPTQAAMRSKSGADPAHEPPITVPCPAATSVDGQEGGVVGACGGGRQGGGRARVSTCRSASWKDARNGVRASPCHASVPVPVRWCGHKNAKSDLEYAMLCAHAGADSNTTQWLKTFPNIKALADEFEFYFLFSR